jgi:very-short-patch-repair endonuclease
MKRFSIPDYKENLTWAAKPEIFSNAKELRKAMTPAEEALWEQLRNSKVIGAKFRRQHPLDIFIADFYCHNKKLIIEIDGGYHDIPEQKEYDEGRTFLLEERGFRIIRFKNEEILNDIETVVLEIKRVLKS